MAHASRLLALTVPAFVLALAACGLSGPAHGPASTTAGATVTMGFASFEPETIHVKAGQTVEFRNTALITHSATDDAKLAEDQKDAAVPNGATPFSSGDIAPGQIFSQTFTQPGTYSYFCTHHEGDGMVATVIVDPAS